MGAALAANSLPIRVLKALRSNNAHKLAILRSFLLKLHVTIAFREQCVITTDANIHTRMNARAALANNDIAGNDSLAAINFYAQSFGF